MKAKPKKCMWLERHALPVGDVAPLRGEGDANLGMRM